MDKHSNFPTPIPHSIDELAVLADATLTDIETSCREYILRGNRLHKNTKSWEEELCYILREQEIRNTRAEVHQQWLEEQFEELTDEASEV